MLCFLTIILFAVDCSAKQIVLYTVLGSHGALVSRSSEIDVEVSIACVYGGTTREKFVHQLPSRLCHQHFANKSTESFPLMVINIQYYMGDFVHTNCESTSSLEITALHFTFNPSFKHRHVGV